MRTLSFTIALLALSISCSTMKTEYKLVPESEEFLSQVRYIITEEEKNMFEEYPPSDREEFIEKFWGRRDPNPYTIRNEFKELYFRRIEEANRLFKGSIAGWLQDRGRIYILLGPPDERTINAGGRPMDPFARADEMDPQRGGRPSMGLGEKPSETWIYYNLLATSQVVKIDFVDAYGTGNYKLVSNIHQLTASIIDALISPNLAYLHELYKQEAQVEQKQTLLLKEDLFNFQLELIKERRRERDRNLIIHIEMPYKRIIFRQEVDDKLVADMELIIEIRDAENNLIWDFDDTYHLSFTPRKLDSEKERNWVLNIPVTYWLDEGKYSVYINLTNLTAGQNVKKLLSMKM